jgi:hypothetical protein
MGTTALKTELFKSENFSIFDDDDDYKNAGPFYRFEHSLPYEMTTHFPYTVKPLH